MKSLQQIVKNMLDVEDWMKSNFSVYDNLIQLITDFLPSEYSKKVAKKLIGKTHDEINDVSINTIFTIPIKYIDFDWIRLFEIIPEWDCYYEDNHYEPYTVTCCKCMIIPDQILINQYKYGDYQDLPHYQISYACNKCNFNNAIAIYDCYYLDGMVTFDMCYENDTALDTPMIIL